MFAIRLTRIVPLLIILGVAALVFYLIAQIKYSPPRAKKYLIIGFTWFNIAGTAIFGLAALYCLLDGNENAFDLAMCFCLTFVIGLIVTRVCNRVFLAHNPQFRFKATRAKREKKDFDPQEFARKAQDFFNSAQNFRR